MYIGEFKFDFNQLLSIPGLLIIGGIVILLIALIIFIATSRKAKKEQKNEILNNEVETNSPVTNNLDVNMASGNPDTNDTKPIIEPSFNNVNNLNTNINNNVNEPIPSFTEPSMENIPPVVPIFNDAPVVNDVPVTNDVKIEEPVSVEPIANDIVTGPVMEPVIPAVEEVKPVVEETPVIPKFVEEEPKVVEKEEPVQPEVSIYGGVKPIIPDLKDINKHDKPIYGGANPLDATQSIPVINPTHEVYGMKVTEPEVAPVKETPANSFEAIQPSTPSFNEARIVDNDNEFVVPNNNVLDADKPSEPYTIEQPVFKPIESKPIENDDDIEILDL